MVDQLEFPIKSAFCVLNFENYTCSDNTCLKRLIPPLFSLIANVTLYRPQNNNIGEKLWMQSVKMKRLLRPLSLDFLSGCMQIRTSCPIRGCTYVNPLPDLIFKTSCLCFRVSRFYHFPFIKKDSSTKAFVVVLVTQ